MYKLQSNIIDNISKLLNNWSCAERISENEYNKAKEKLINYLENLVNVGQLNSYHIAYFSSPTRVKVEVNTTPEVFPIYNIYEDGTCTITSLYKA